MISPLEFSCDTANSYLGTKKAIRGFYLRVVSCPTDAVLTFRFDGRDEIPYVPGETRRTPGESWKTIEVKSTVAGAVLCTIGTDPTDRETTAPGILGGGSYLAVLSPATAAYYSNLGLGANAVSSIPIVPLGKRLVAGHVSLDPAAPGPIYVLNTLMGGVKGLQIMPGKTSPPLTVAPFTDVGAHNVYLANPNPVAVTAYSYGEYIN